MVTVRRGVIMMSPCVPVPTKQPSEVQVAPVSAMFVALTAVGAPLSGFPRADQVEPPSVVPTTVPTAPSAKQLELSLHAIPLSAWVEPLDCGDQVAPPSVDFRTRACPPMTAPAA